MEAIRLADISKSFKVYKEKRTTLKEKFLFFKSSNYEEFKALTNIDFVIEKGETVGLIGRNGSGKSTLLKILSKIIYPDTGTLLINGKMSSLLELGAGFHPDFTGRENIYMNASILGLSKREIDAKLDQIITFSELGEFIDRSVRVYSSGMYMRLAFSIAISVDPDILLIDEVLAVGDAAFQNKCINKIKELKAQGKTIVIVAHDNGVIEKLCDKAVWLHNGVIREIGLPKEVTLKYMSELTKMEDQRLLNEEENSVISNENSSDELGNFKEKSKKIEINKIASFDKNNVERRAFVTGEAMKISIDYKVHEKYDDIVFGVGIFTADNICCYGTNTFIDEFNLENLPEMGTINFNISNLTLIPGEYLLDVAVHKETGEPYDYQVRVYKFQVTSDKRDIGISRQDHYWEVVGNRWEAKNALWTLK